MEAINNPYSIALIMYAYQRLQQRTSIFLLLTLCLASCMSSLNLAYTPIREGFVDKQKGLIRPAQAKENPYFSTGIDKATIAAYSFTASSGEAISFFEEGGVWKAKVTCPVEGVRVLPVACGEGKQLFPVLCNLYQQGTKQHKHHIHICNSGQAPCIFIGTLPVKGGMLGSEADNSLALRSAISVGDLVLVKLLLKSGYDPNMADELGFTPLHVATIHGYLAIAELLLENAANPNIVEKNGDTPLDWAVYKGNLALVDLFLEQGADPNIHNQDGFTTLHTAIVQGQTALVSLLLAKGADPNMPIADQSTPLHWAAYDGHLEIVNLLLAAGADPTITDQHGLTPLYRAIDQGHVAVVSLLLENAPNLNLADQDGDTPLHWVAYDGNLELVNLLLAAGADPTLADAAHCTPLHVAAYKGHMSIIARLLLCNVDINAQDAHGNTFLHKLVSDASVSVEDRLHRFLEVMQSIAVKQEVVLENLTGIMEGYCPELTNKDAKSILAMQVDYLQGIDLNLKNQNDECIVAIVRELLVATTDTQAYEKVVKNLERHQSIGGWMFSRAKHKRKASTVIDTNSQDGIQEPDLKKCR